MTNVLTRRLELNSVLRLKIAARRTWAACKQATVPLEAKKKTTSISSSDSEDSDDDEDANARRGLLDEFRRRYKFNIPMTLS